MNNKIIEPAVKSWDIPNLDWYNKGVYYDTSGMSMENEFSDYLDHTQKQ